MPGLRGVPVIGAWPLLRELLGRVPPEASVPAKLVTDALAEIQHRSQPPDAPPRADGWTVPALAARYGWARSTARGRVQAGEFGVPGQAGGPRKLGRGWLVPHAAVLARDRAVHATHATVPADNRNRPAAEPEQRRAKPVTLRDARRQRESERSA